MIVGLYTSRIILQTLGEDNYGVNNVVGGVVTLFSIVTGPIANSISRFLTYGLGKGNLEKLRITFSTSIGIIFILSLIILILGETVGVWFLNHKLNIPPESVYPAKWVLQCSIISSIISLLNIPFNAALIAHEKMNIFAYMSIYDVMAKLLLVLLLVKFPFNPLITYSVGLVIISIISRIIYQSYCHKHFAECRYTIHIEKSEFFNMTKFAWWSFFGNTANLFNTQGTSILMNMFFGIVINTAKGLSATVETAIMNLVNSFTTAFTPQITKSFASGDLDYMYKIMCKGSKFSIFFLMFFLIPLEFEAPIVLRIWLGEYPEVTVKFLRLSLLCTATLLLGSPFYQGIMATGNLKSYQITVTIIAITVFPLTWIAYKLGGSPESYYYIYLIIYNILVWIRMKYIRKLLGFNVSVFFKDVIIPIAICTILTIVPVYFIFRLMEDNWVRLIVVIISSIFILGTAILIFGMTKSERGLVVSYFKKRIKL